MTNFFFSLRRGWLVTLFACTASTTLFAQTQVDVSLDTLMRQSQTILRQIDARDASSVWESASPLMREGAKKNEFVARVESDRAGLGPVASRLWQTVARVSYVDGNVGRIPPGDYININYLALDGNGQLLQELISFHLEDEKQWRMTGYVSQKVAAK
jgi:hypothetical protein